MKFEKVPEYVAATPQQVAEARNQLTTLRGNSAFALMQGARRAALQAKFNSAMKLSALEYAEFGDIVPAGYSTHLHAGSAAAAAERDRQQRAAQEEFEEMERKRRATPHPMTRAEAQAMLSTAEYLKWVDKNQDLIARTLR